jgi:hypothetical protein
MIADAVGLTLEQTRLYARQVALPEIGVQGQARLGEATVALFSGGSAFAAAAGAAAAEHLAAAGVGQVDAVLPPATGQGWLQALANVQAAARFSLDDDALLRACVRLGRPVVFGRAHGEGVDLLSLRRHGPCPHQSLDVPARVGSVDLASSAAAPLLGILVASELLWILAAPQDGPRARLLRLSLAGDDAPQASEIPWAPECFVCGGRGQEAVFAEARS